VSLRSLFKNRFLVGSWVSRSGGAWQPIAVRRVEGELNMVEQEKRRPRQQIIGLSRGRRSSTWLTYSVCILASMRHAWQMPVG